jgi:hypothetical protein
MELMPQDISDNNVAMQPITNKSQLSIDLSNIDSSMFATKKDFDNFMSRINNPDASNNIVSNYYTNNGNGFSQTYAESWSKGIVLVLKKIRSNCINMSNYHNKRYHFYRILLIWAFRVPLILLSGLNGFSAIGGQPYVSQASLSIFNSVIAITCGVITSIELLINIQKKMEMELESHKSFYKLAIEIYKILKLEKDRRGCDGKDYLQNKFSEYEKLIVMSNAIHPYSVLFRDELTREFKVGDNLDDILEEDEPRNMVMAGYEFFTTRQQYICNYFDVCGMC